MFPVLEGTDYSHGLHSGSCVLCACFCTRFTPLHAVSVGGISCLCLNKASFFSAEQDKNGDGARELKDMKSDRMKVLQMNVCSDQEVAEAVDYVKKTLKDPEEGVWESLFFWARWFFGALMESFLWIRPNSGQVVPVLQCQNMINKLEGLTVRQCCIWVSGNSHVASTSVPEWETKTGLDGKTLTLHPVKSDE